MTTLSTVNRRGIALLLVLWLVVVLGAIGTGVATGARTRIGVAGNLELRTEARLAAESGIVAATRALADSIARLGETPARRVYLNRLERAPELGGEQVLGDARFQVAFADVSARLDVNVAPEDALARFFAQFTAPTRARDIARELRARIAGDMPQGTTPLRDLDELRLLPSMDEHTARAAAPYLTVDGDGRINGRAAPPAVRIAAGGELVDEPSRLLVVSRGWRPGRAITHEIQAVYAVQGNAIALVRWRERER